MRFELNHDRRNISDEDLLADLRRVASDRSEQQVRQRTYKDHGKYGVTTLIRRFGSWNGAVKSAGLDTPIERNVPDADLYTALYDLWVALGRQPNYSEVQKPRCRFHVATYERRFGSWRKALEEFVAYANSEGRTAPVASTGSSAASRKASRSPDLRLRFQVLQRDNFRCRACGASPAVAPGVVLQVDHITPWSRGGETVVENLQTLCDGCNQGKSNLHGAR